MKATMQKIDRMIEPLRKLADFAGTPLLLLVIRIHVATIFFASGWGRFKDYASDNWDTQLFLFEYEHPVPGLSPSLAAPMTTIAELILPILVAFGLFGRLGAASMIVMTTIIEFTYNHPEISLDVCLYKTGLLSCLYRTDHIVWITMLLVILVMGPGKLSLDTLVRKWLGGK